MTRLNESPRSFGNRPMYRVIHDKQGLQAIFPSKHGCGILYWGTLFRALVFPPGILRHAWHNKIVLTRFSGRYIPFRDGLSSMQEVRLTLKKRAFPSQGRVRFNIAHLPDLGIQEGDHVDLINEAT